MMNVIVAASGGVVVPGEWVGLERVGKLSVISWCFWLVV
jgi:hypothetical protein